MKNIFTVLFALVSLYALAQEEIIFSEDFEGDALPGWAVNDLDGDGFNWEIVFSSDQAEEQGWGPDMSLMLASFGYSLLPGNEQPLYPDNVIITPEIDLPDSGNISLNFLLGTNVDYMNDHNFALYVFESSEGFNVDMIPFFEMNFAGISTAQEIDLDLSSYQGSTIKIAMRHYNSDEQFVLLLDDFNISLNSNLGVKDVNAPLSVKIYPNPVKEILNIKSNESVNKVEIYNTAGKLLLTSNSTQIKVSHLPAGAYFAKVHMDFKTVTEQFIKK